ncbi:uncharacterized protein Z519_12439 [Cladophialophora bantiana CBS 173.52]|uniref:Uncharacterized protein n=1 Tax=Cladophialophora bantiana (strain ATCC 10958 / CBS 173.52 / CDC B-1940 / NIH 8579) TaxID=1442370 RepID=A0A0D2HRH1_CLAB1|nr:uncharacterized protein Z519_12439 [Cladophialophora bantiana CBS 173.52]KIW86974.1 hypothetical protein Z519_12439 [Cladophialophora bantiana CBS 173.52]
MIAVSLVYFTPAGSEVLTKLLIEGECSTFYLPNHPLEDSMSLSSEIDEHHSNICLEVRHNFVLLRTFNYTGPCSVLEGGRIDIQLPLATDSHHKSIILRSDVNFLGPFGRWGIR